MKYRLGRARALLGQPSPARIAHSRGTVALHPVAYEIDISVVFVCRPMPLKIVEKGRPIRRQAILFKIALWKGERVIDSDERRDVLRQDGNQPFSQGAPRPISPRLRWRDSGGFRISDG